MSGHILRAGSVKTDTISENTSAAGVTIESVLLKDDNITATDIDASGTLDVTGTSTLGTTTTGAADFPSAQVNGNITVDTDITVAGNTSLNTVSSSGAVSFQTVAVTANATIGGSQTVTGNTGLSTVETSGLATLNSASITNNCSVGTLVPTTGLITNEISEKTGNSVSVESVTFESANTNTGNLNVTGDLSVGGTSTLTDDTTISGNFTFNSVVQNKQSISLINELESSLISSIGRHVWQTVERQEGSVNLVSPGNNTIQVGVEGIYKISWIGFCSGGTAKFAYIAISANSNMSSAREYIQETSGGYFTHEIVTQIDANYYIQVFTNYGNNYRYGDTGTPVRYPRLSIVRISW